MDIPSFATEPLYFEKVWVVVPAYNEDPAILRSVVLGLCEEGFRVVVIDDGSDEPLVVPKGSFLCRHPINLGQGAALQTGIRFSLERQANYIVTFDADGQHSKSDLLALLIPVMRDEVDVTLGSRFLGEPCSTMPPLRAMMLKMATIFTRVSTGLPLTDTHNGLRAFNRRAAKLLRITQNRMSHASQILDQIARLGLRFKEVPVKIAYTDYSLAKGQKMSNSINIIWESFSDRLFR